MINEVVFPQSSAIHILDKQSFQTEEGQRLLRGACNIKSVQCWGVVSEEIKCGGQHNLNGCLIWHLTTNICFTQSKSFVFALCSTICKLTLSVAWNRDQHRNPSFPKGNSLPALTQHLVSSPRTPSLFVLSISDTCCTFCFNSNCPQNFMRFSLPSQIIFWSRSSAFFWQATNCSCTFKVPQGEQSNTSVVLNSWILKGWSRRGAVTQVSLNLFLSLARNLPQSNSHSYQPLTFLWTNIMSNITSP